MDVYMDAVLNPAIYTKRAIFEQEGWHYELDVPEGAPLAAGTLRYNGVVFNEMKGALSDPMSVLDDAVNRRRPARHPAAHLRAVPRHACTPLQPREQLYRALRRHGGRTRARIPG